MAARPRPPVSQAGTVELATRIKDLTARLERQDAELAQALTEIAGLASDQDAALDGIAGLLAALQ